VFFSNSPSNGLTPTKAGLQSKLEMRGCDGPCEVAVASAVLASAHRAPVKRPNPTGRHLSLTCRSMLGASQSPSLIDTKLVLT